MQCNAMQCNAMQCSAVQCSAVQCSAVQCSAVQCSAVQCSAVQCSAVQCEAMRCDAMRCDAMRCDAMRCNAMQCNAMQCNAMQCNAMQCNAMQCNAMQCNAMQEKPKAENIRPILLTCLTKVSLSCLYCITIDNTVYSRHLNSLEHFKIMCNNDDKYPATWRFEPANLSYEQQRKRMSHRYRPRWLENHISFPAELGGYAQIGTINALMTDSFKRAWFSYCNQSLWKPIICLHCTVNWRAN